MMIFKSEFVTHAPAPLEPGILYISIQFSMALHLCPCGCGTEVVNKISPPRWHLTWDGEHASLFPSVGNFQLDCRSHYIIRKNKVIWCDDWSEDRIKKALKRDKNEIKEHLKASKNKSKM